jgi:hypothetical protein
MTAIEWLVDKLNNDFGNNDFLISYANEISQAKEMEKEQIEDAFCDGVDDEYEYHINNSLRKNSEQYYNEKFKKK